MTISVSPEVPYPDPQRETLDNLLRLQAEDPDFFHDLYAPLLQTVWDTLPSVEKDAIAAAQRYIQPDDVAERARSTAAFLLSQYLIQKLRAGEDDAHASTE